MLFLQVEQQYSDDDNDAKADTPAASQSDPAASRSGSHTDHDKAEASDATADHSSHSSAHISLQETDTSHEELAAGLQEEDASRIAEEDDESADAVDEAYVMAYLGRHCCSQSVGSQKESEDAICGGTMTPVGIHGDMYACNMCGHERLESERIAELEEINDRVAKEAQDNH